MDSLLQEVHKARVRTEKLGVVAEIAVGALLDIMATCDPEAGAAALVAIRKIEPLLTDLRAGLPRTLRAV